MAILLAASATYESPSFFWAFLLLFTFMMYKKIALSRILVLIVVSICLSFYFTAQKSSLEEPVTLPTLLTWTSTYKIDGTSLRGFMIDERGDKIYVRYQIKSAGEKALYENHELTGQSYIVEGKIEEQKMAHPYAFNMAAYLRSHNARGVIIVENWHYREQRFSVSYFFAKQRKRLLTHIEHHFPSSIAAEAQALLVGSTELVDETVARAYEKLGITHLFAISGLHVALMSFIFFESLLRFRIRRQLALLLLICALPTYAIIVGGAPSVWRAVLMVELVVCARFFRWRMSTIDALSIAFIILLILNPPIFYQIGFQLSFLATFSIVMSTHMIQQANHYVTQLFLLSAVCQLFVYPILLYHFYELSITSLLANIMFVPLFSFIILPVNVFLLIVSFIAPRIATILLSLYTPIRDLLTKAILTIEQFPYHLWVAGKPSLLVVLILFVSVVACFVYIERKRWSLAVAVLVVPPFCWQMMPYMQKDLIVTFVDVGQGDCIVIELPYRRAIYIVDTGGVLRFEQEEWQARAKNFEIGTQVVVPYLKGRGMGKVDKLILTHADADHVEAAEEVLREIAVGEIDVTPNAWQKQVMEDLLQEAQRKKVRLIERLQGDAWQKGETSFRYLWPTDTQYEGNDDSLVLLIENGAFRLLLTGDLEQGGEEALVAQLAEDIRQITVLKLGHHGSKTSSTASFLQTTTPQLAVITAGENNRYKHPHSEVMTRLEEFGIPSFITGQVGTVTIRWNGTRFRIATMQKEKDFAEY